MSLLDLVEIRQLWGKGEDAVYRAVARGELRAYGRPGRQKYYSAAELVALYGEPAGDLPPVDNRGRNRGRDNGAEVTGGQLRFDEFDGAAAAA